MTDPTLTDLTLTEFLLARIAEREAVARAATPGPWRFNSSKVNAIDLGEAVFAGPRGAYAITVASTGPADDLQSMADASHIAINDPTRILAECEAMRQIVKFHESWPTLVETPLETEDVSDSMSFRVSKQINWLTTREYVARFGIEPPTVPMLAALALLYADHEDCLPEWLP